MSFALAAPPEKRQSEFVLCGHAASWIKTNSVSRSGSPNGGSGLRLTELLGLRVKDVDLDRRQLIVRAGHAAAALAAKDGCRPRDVSIPKLQKLLASQGVYLG